MGAHDKYGKKLLGEILGARWSTLTSSRSYDWGGVRADLDGVIRSAETRVVECAVEIEAKVYKQIRGAILDLAYHSAPKKLLVIIRAQAALGSEEKVRGHCAEVWKEIGDPDSAAFRIVVLKGTGDRPSPDLDKGLLIQALHELGILAATV